MLSWVVRGGKVVDGTGAPEIRADVGVADGKIVRIGRIDPSELPAPERVFDAAGRCVAPGFIDVHSHSDLTLPVYGGAASSLLQGITTEVAGSCGWSLAPVKASTRRGVLNNLLKGLCGITVGQVGFDWHSFAEYAASLSRRGIGTNLYPVLGQSLLRAHVVGPDKRSATPEEVDAMRAMVRRAMAEGCRGLSTGRSYLPGGHADTDEIVAMCGELAPFGGIYTSHIKSESDELLEAVAEVVTIGRRAGVKVQVSHHKAIGPANFGKVGESLAAVEAAREAGVDINVDVYPYDFAQVFLLSRGLAPGWRNLDDESYLARLDDAAARERLGAKLARAPGSVTSSPENYLLAVAPGRDDLAGLSLAEAAAREGKEPFDLCCELLRATGLRARIAARMDEADVRTVLRHPLAMVGTDAFTLDGEIDPAIPLHPRHFGSFPRVLGHYRRDVGLFELPAAVHKVSGMPAAKLGLGDRGVLAEGNWADLVVFDPATIGDRATAVEPTLPPVGISAVFVNGELAMRDGRPTGVKSGRVLLGPR